MQRRAGEQREEGEKPERSFGSRCSLRMGIHPDDGERRKESPKNSGPSRFREP
jgi:hypothetical protein